MSIGIHPRYWPAIPQLSPDVARHIDFLDQQRPWFGKLYNLNWLAFMDLRSDIVLQVTTICCLCFMSMLLEQLLCRMIDLSDLTRSLFVTNMAQKHAVLIRFIILHYIQLMCQ